MTRTRAAGAALSALFVLLTLAGTAFAGPRAEKPGVEVAPGVFLASSSDLAEDRAGFEPLPSAGAPRNSPRIVGGTETTIAEWPWQVALTLNPEVYAGNGFERQFCGGSLLAPRYVLTAAHCVFDFNTGSFRPFGEHASITGRTTLSDGAQGQEILWSNYYVPVDASGRAMFNPNTLEWDFVIAELEVPSPASNSTPIKLAGRDEASSWAPGDENAFTTGWGNTISGAPSRSDALRKVQIDMIADSTCGSETSYGSTFRAETMVCAGEALGVEDSCQGDSGGPLVVSIGGGSFRLVGDTSFGPALGCGVPNFPGVYGRVAQDPMCSSIRSAVQQLAGTDVTGAGGCRQGPPETQITNGPKNKTKKSNVMFEFTSTEPGSSFECAVDGGAYGSCSSPITVKVKQGRHTFRVRATSPSGDRDLSPAADSWKRKKKKRKK